MKSVFIKLDKMYELRFTLKARKDFESLSGKRLFDDLAGRSETTNNEKLWAMLRQTDPKLSIEDVESLIDTHSDFIKVRRAVNEAIDESVLDESPNVAAPAGKKS